LERGGARESKQGREKTARFDEHGNMFTWPLNTGYKIDSGAYIPRVGFGGLAFNSDSDHIDN
jgi:hypothetical protein